MGKVEKIEDEVQALSPTELAQFRAWFLEYDWAAWDQQLGRDVQAGRLDDLADKALREHAADETTPLGLITPRRISGRPTGPCRHMCRTSPIRRTRG